MLVRGVLNGSRMTGDCHVRFCEELAGRFPPLWRKRRVSRRTSVKTRKKRPLSRELLYRCESSLQQHFNNATIRDLVRIYVVYPELTPRKGMFRKRLLKLSDRHSLLLFGARGVGKSSLLEVLFHFEDNLYINLLDPLEEARFCSKS